MVVDADDPDPAPEEVAVLSCPTLMEGADGRRALAERVLEFAAGARLSDDRCERPRSSR